MAEETIRVGPYILLEGDVSSGCQHHALVPGVSYLFGPVRIEGSSDTRPNTVNAFFTGRPFLFLSGEMCHHSDSPRRRGRAPRMHICVTEVGTLGASCEA